MTNKEAIETFKDYKENGYDLRTSNSELFDIAIRSLKAWEEVLTELKKEKLYPHYPYNFYEGIDYAIDKINQHLAKIN